MHTTLEVGLWSYQDYIWGWEYDSWMGIHGLHLLLSRLHPLSSERSERCQPPLRQMWSLAGHLASKRLHRGASTWIEFFPFYFYFYKETFSSGPLSALLRFTGRLMPSPWTNPASKIFLWFHAKTGIERDTFFYFIFLTTTNRGIEISCVSWEDEILESTPSV